MSDFSDCIVTEQKSSVLEIKICRPDKKNAINLEMYLALEAALLQAEENSSVKVVILTGSNACFTSGNDLAVFASPSQLTDLDNPIFKFMSALRTVSKPVVAAVDGIAIGIGTTMLLHCDFIVASRSAEFRLPFVDLGLTPEYAASFLLPRLVGHAKACEWLMLGESISAEQGLQFGLVNRIADAPLLSARELAEVLTKKPQRALRTTKALLKATLNASVDRVIEKEVDLFSRALAGNEFAEAAAAFFEKREADFSRLD